MYYDLNQGKTVVIDFCQYPYFDVCTDRSKIASVNARKFGYLAFGL